MRCLLLDVEERAGAAVFVADLRDHRRHLRVVPLELLLRPAEMVPNGNTMALMRRIALAEDFALVIHVHLAPRVGLRPRGDVRGGLTGVACLLDDRHDGGEGVLHLGHVPRLHEDVFAVRAPIGLSHGLRVRDGSCGSNGQSGYGEKELVHLKPPVGKVGNADENLIGLTIIAPFGLLVQSQNMALERAFCHQRSSRLLAICFDELSKKL